MKFSARITINQKVIAKKPLTNLYEMNSTCTCQQRSLCLAVVWCRVYKYKRVPVNEVMNCNMFISAGSAD